MRHKGEFEVLTWPRDTINEVRGPVEKDDEEQFVERFAALDGLEATSVKPENYQNGEESGFCS